jgi:hypothetical protein
MINVTVTHNAKDARQFVVELSGSIARPKALNAALGRRLASDLKQHFLARNKEPNKMQARKTNFWSQVRRSTVLTQADDRGATVTIGDNRFRIHLKGGTITPTGGRKWLTIPLIAEARGKNVADYESIAGVRLFRVGRALFERSSKGDRSQLGSTRIGLKTKSGFREGSIRSQSRIRPVFALKRSVKIPEDPRALPDTAVLLEGLNEAAREWMYREIVRAARKGGSK